MNNLAQEDGAEKFSLNIFLRSLHVLHATVHKEDSKIYQDLLWDPILNEFKYCHDNLFWNFMLQNILLGDIKIPQETSISRWQMDGVHWKEPQ